MKSSTTTNLLLLYVLSLLYDSTIVMAEPSQEGTLTDPRGDSVGGKRTYQYRSEYKRLPLFQFGLGKRMAPSYEEKRTKPLNFGLGKRKPGYVFGLGKRNSYEEDAYSDELYDHSVPESYSQDKRAESGFTFGLGKRDGDTWMEKRLVMNYAKGDFPFGLGKRYYDEDDDDDGYFP